MKSKLNPNIFEDEAVYFFSLMTDRFRPLVDRWAAALSQRFGKTFKPIYVLAAEHNQLFEEENYIVLNQELEALWQKSGDHRLVHMPHPEDLSREFCSSVEVSKLTDQLLTKQDQVFVLTFSSVWVELPRPEMVLLGPNPQVAERFDDKAEHIRTFSALGFEINKSYIFEDLEELMAHQLDLPFFISATYSSSGIEAAVVHDEAGLKAYVERLRPVNRQLPLVVTKFLPDIEQAVNTSALVVGEGVEGTSMVCISDQLLRGHIYLGNVFPSVASGANVAKMNEMTRQTGAHLASQGFRGLFGLDFLITSKGDCYPTDLNPRRQGGYLCNVLSSKQIDLIDLELRLVLGETVEPIDEAALTIDYAWAHSKLSPLKKGLELVKELEEGRPLGPFEEIGSTYSAQYYPKGSKFVSGNPGFYLATGYDRDQLHQKLDVETAGLLRDIYAD